MVCSANVCRSPAMAISFASAAERAGLSVDVVSAGRMAENGAEICRVATGVVAGLDGGARAATLHRAQRLSRDLIDSATLILGATRQERAAVATLSPRARSRVFTLTEAIALGEIGRQRDEERRPGGVQGFVELLNAHRGALPLAAPTRPSRWRRAVVDPLDLPDAHGGRRAEHTARVIEASRLSERLVALIVDEK